MDDALLLALVNHGLIHGLSRERAWAVGGRLVAEGGEIKHMADLMRKEAADELLG